MIHPKVKVPTVSFAALSAALVAVAAAFGFTPNAAELAVIQAVGTVVIFVAGYLAPGHVTE